MTYGLQVFDAAGALVWDSPVVSGGIIVDSRAYGEAASDTIDYPAFAGRSAFLIGTAERPTTIGLGVTISTAPGFPRVTVNTNTGGGQRRFKVMVF